MLVLTIGIVRNRFYLFIFYSEKFSTSVWRLLFAVNADGLLVNANLNLSDINPAPQRWDYAGISRGLGTNIVPR